MVTPTSGVSSDIEVFVLLAWVGESEVKEGCCCADWAFVGVTVFDSLRATAAPTSSVNVDITARVRTYGSNVLVSASTCLKTNRPNRMSE